MTLIITTIALLLDHWLGEPRKWHPLVGFGWLVRKLEYRLLDQEPSPTHLRWKGVAAVILLTVPFAWLAYLISEDNHFGTLFSVIALYLAVGAQSLAQHAQQVLDAIADGDIPLARKYVSWLVSRETDQLTSHEIAAATAESTLENGNDAIFGAVFWFIVAGAPGAIMFRLINTLDAMWGYRNARFNQFGWAAAKLDDLVNWAPARLTALSYALVGNTRNALHCWWSQASVWKSPNAGPVMSSGAGALSIQLGGEACYHGKRETRPALGNGSKPDAQDIQRCITLLQRSEILWIAVIAILTLLGIVS